MILRDNLSQSWSGGWQQPPFVVSKGGLPTATTYFKKHKISKGETVAQSLKERFDYGQNPDKTEGGELISSYGCDHMTADAEFLLSKAKYKATTGREQRWDADVLCYQTHEDRGVGSCSYDLISYAGGRERYLDGNTITFVLEADGTAPVPDIDRATQAEFVRFREGVASLLEGSSYLLFCSGPAEDPDTQQAVENILAGLDALEARLYSNAG